MTESATHWIGRPVRRREDPRFLRGQARYVDDIVLPGMAHMVVVRSRVAHAILRKVDMSAARRADGALAGVPVPGVAQAVRHLPPTHCGRGTVSSTHHS